ncbi:MAG: hypothetical protein K8I03_08935 [Ignavibacteria bacterium]|nr:hypothetical protein [Ignavibacteria bacterium]
MRRVISVFFKALGFIVLFFVTFALVNSAMDIYNNFAYDRAILRNSPYGYIPLLNDPNDYHNASAKVKGGDFVYVENWESADNGQVVFAKVRSKFNTGYVNKRLLVEANINVMPIFSVMLLSLMLLFILKRIYKKYTI